MAFFKVGKLTPFSITGTSASSGMGLIVTIFGG
jgi:hypothetical protein